jgi:uncharacterized protein
VSGCYFDASAVVKLAFEEAESGALRRWVRDWPGRLTSRVTSVEVPRALQRKGGRGLELGTASVADALRAFSILELDAEIANRAATLAPASLRSLDAIHLATALELGDELGAFVTYDARLAEAARLVGLEVVAPAG